MLRKLQGVEPFFDALLSGNLEHYQEGKSFLYDSLFCEYGYLINLDTMKLELYVGFQKEPQEGNRYGTEPTSGHDKNYYPSKLIGELDLLDLTLEEMKAIFNAEQEKEKEEEY